jgi:hypothetical protein
LRSRARPASLLTVAMRHWRAFLPMWLLPLGLFASIFLPLFRAPPGLFFWLVLAPAMVVCGYVAKGPLRQGGATLGQTAFWAMLVPLLIWVTVVGAFWGLAFWSSAISLGRSASQ